ncbi:hypothetical protein HGB24_00160 [Candidatus Saccharibacteria bacterium]|nr:hypothetical protein [Candidatus Saccharibacteria bacterium]
MRVVVLFRDKEDSTRTVTDFLRDFERQTGHLLETIDPDTEGGSAFCNTYGIVEYPTIIAMTNDGIMQNLWRGLPLPTISELSYYVQNNN